MEDKSGLEQFKRGICSKEVKGIEIKRGENEANNDNSRIYREEDLEGRNLDIIKKASLLEQVEAIRSGRVVEGINKRRLGIGDEELRILFEALGWNKEKHKGKIVKLLRGIGINFDVIAKSLGLKKSDAIGIFNRSKKYGDLGKVERKLGNFCLETAERLLNSIDDELIADSNLKDRIYAATNLMMTGKELINESAEILRTERPLMIVYNDKRKAKTGEESEQKIGIAIGRQ